MTTSGEHGAGSRRVSHRLRPTRSRGRPKVVPDEMQRAAIVAAAAALFVENGYGRTTMNDVVARCRISKATLYRLFHGKTELFAALVDAHRQGTLALPGDYADLPVDAALERIFRIDITPQADRERIALMRLVRVESAHYPELVTIIREHGRDKSRAMLSDWLGEQRALGRIAVEDSFNAAKMLMDLIFGAVIVKAEGDVEWPGEGARRDYLRQCIRVFVKGVEPR